MHLYIGSTFSIGMVDLIAEILIPIVQLFLGVFSSVLSYEALKKFYYRPNVKIKVWDRESGENSEMNRQISFSKEYPFIFGPRNCQLDVTGEEIIIALTNAGRSSAKGFSFYGWIPEGWTIKKSSSSIFTGGLIEVDDWEREIDNYQTGNTEKYECYRFAGNLPPKFCEYVKIDVKPVVDPETTLELSFVGENTRHELSTVNLIFENA